MATTQIKVSKTKIRKFKVGDMVDKASAMSSAIFGLVLVFTGTKPFTAAQILTLTGLYTSTKATFKTGGLLAKPAFVAAHLALLNCMLDFADYVDSIAVGSLVIITQSTLPDNVPVNYAELIIAGANPTGVVAKIGLALQLVTDCIPLGKGVGYTAILSEGMPLMAGFSIDSNGQIHIPAGMTNRVFINSTATRKKLFNGLLPSTTYYLYYIQMVGDVVSQMSAAVPVASGVA